MRETISVGIVDVRVWRVLLEYIFRVMSRDWFKVSIAKHPSPSEGPADAVVIPE